MRCENVLRKIFSQTIAFLYKVCYYIQAKIANALLAQLDRVFGYEPKGQGFESLAARHYECP